MNNSLTASDVAGIPLTPIPSPRSTEARGERLIDRFSTPNSAESSVFARNCARHWTPRTQALSQRDRPALESFLGHGLRRAVGREGEEATVASERELDAKLTTLFFHVG
jgi:hypothetical protein